VADSGRDAGEDVLEFHIYCSTFGSCRSDLLYCNSVRGEDTGEFGVCAGMVDVRQILVWFFKFNTLRSPALAQLMGHIILHG